MEEEVIMDALKQGYSDSHALIIGIDQYKKAGNLDYAVSDAEAVKDILLEKFNFKKENITLLKNDQASKNSILENYLSFSESTNVNDRVLFFFAGHGITIPGRNRDVGYLVPHDGNRGLLGSLIRWDEFTRNADLIPAKHLLFIMDACYGGLAITRGLQAGSMRFLKDMTSRYTRQVITAGKANEVVADSGGPLPDHSVFTGHLLEALNGKASDKDGNITANAVMAYVYEHVSKDQNSNQTPHFGFLEGDGDFIFQSKLLESNDNDDTKPEDVLVSVPSTIIEERALDMGQDSMALIKEYLSDVKFNIKLQETIMAEVRKVISQLTDDSFNIPSSFTLEDFQSRITKYESIVQPLANMLSCIAYWGNEEQSAVIKVSLRRLTDHLLNAPRNGLVVYLGLRWYPILLISYMVGISAIANDKYKNLADLLKSKIINPSTQKQEIFALFLGETFSDIVGAFKKIPGYERNYVPLNDYLHKYLQPKLDDLIFLGSDYDPFFDKFEILLALIHADADYKEDRNDVWGPPGRFGWKVRRSETSPYHNLVAEAEAEKNNWLPLKAGIFSSYERFNKIQNLFKTSLLDNLRWY